MNDQTNSHLPSSEVRRYAVNGAPQICRARPESDFRTPQVAAQPGETIAREAVP